MNRLQAIFVISLVQDVNILRPLAVMASRDFGMAVRFLVADRFTTRDMHAIWQAELAELVGELDAEMVMFDSEFTALAALTGHGLLFSASESSLHGHATPRGVFRVAPPSYLKVTLQHGLECVGFRHSAAHVVAHGPSASFEADVVCAWYAPDQLTALHASQLGKIVVTGPSAALQQFPADTDHDAPGTGGLICENLHSVRLSVAGAKAQFVDVFGEFCERVGRDGDSVILRPHPGGQYMLRNGVPLAANVRVENAPMYRLDMRQFAYGISAPSSVLLDMVMAGIPTAVWRDRDGAMDTDAYAGLPSVTTVDDWVAFARQAVAAPESFEAGRRLFLERFDMPLDPADVYSRFGQIFESAVAMSEVLRGSQRSAVLLPED